MLALIRRGAATTRAEIAELTGLARSTLAERLDLLIDHGLVLESPAVPSTAGRPPRTLQFNAAAGVILTADLTETRARVGMLDLSCAMLADRSDEIAGGDGRRSVLATVSSGFRTLLRDTGVPAERVRGIGVGVAAPVVFPTGRALDPARMPRWAGVAVADRLRAEYRAPVFVDRSVNLMAVAEQRIWFDDFEDLVLVTVDPVVTGGIVTGGRILRGAVGAAGDIGHMRVTGHEDVDCWCGGSGCLEVVAGGLADAVALANRRDPVASRTLRDAGRSLGEVLATCVSLFNPGAVVISGLVGAAGRSVLQTVREGIARYAPPLATRDLTVAISRLGHRAGAIGAALMVAEQIFAPDAIDRALMRG